MTATVEADEYVFVRRQWNDWRVARVRASALDGLHWDTQSGGFGREGGWGNVAPRPFLHAYVWCNEIVGEFGHSCMHGPPPHRIKVCVVKKDNTKSAYARLSATAAKS